jgi:Raf kinase inhibitor-like YbhB/YbcL family protein
MELMSDVFAPDALIPALYTCDGRDISPPLAWTKPPAEAKSFAIIADDPDAPMGTWLHWLMWNIPPGARSLAESQSTAKELPGGARQGTNDFHKIGYGGPCPPSGTHRYNFRLYALDRILDLPGGASRSQLEAAMKGHILAETRLVGKYRRG